jgi:hypothetical protein
MLGVIFQSAIRQNVVALGNLKYCFLPFVAKFGLLTEYFETQEKLKVALRTFEVSKNETRKQIIFLN